MTKHQSHLPIALIPKKPRDNVRLAGHEAQYHVHHTITEIKAASEVSIH
jgi:hypothetical protein